jgi:hypothetical protein
VENLAGLGRAKRTICCWIVGSEKKNGVDLTADFRWKAVMHRAQ